MFGPYRPMSQDRPMMGRSDRSAASVRHAATGTPSGQEPYVHLLTKDGSGYRRKAPAKIFRETDLYTIKMAGGLLDLTLEHGLSQLEDNFMRVVREFIVPRRPLPTIPR